MKALCVLCFTLWSCAPEHIVQGRPYELRVPKNVGERPLPLVVLLHGYSVNGLIQDVVFPFSKEVDARRFLYAMPDGTRDTLNKRFWNATDACCNFQHLAIDDVGFLRGVIDDVKAHYAVDPAKVFLVGHSNGAFMALRMACEASDVVSGVVSVAGAAAEPFSSCSGRPIPVLLLHGTADTTIQYDGGSAGAVYPSAATTAERYAHRNGCSTVRRPAQPLDLVDDPAPDSDREAFEGCPADARVELWTIRGGGHLPPFNAAWPGLMLDWLEGVQ